MWTPSKKVPVPLQQEVDAYEQALRRVQENRQAAAMAADKLRRLQEYSAVVEATYAQERRLIVEGSPTVTDAYKQAFARAQMNRMAVGMAEGELRRLQEYSAVVEAAFDQTRQYLVGYLAIVPAEEVRRAELLPRPPLDRLRHHLQTLVPVLYAQVLEPTLADLREEHALAVRPWQARWVLLRGCGALAAAAVHQLGFSLLGRIAAIWQTRSLK